MAYNYDIDAPANQYPVDKIPDAWGYGLIAIADDGGALCEACVRDETNPVHEAQVGDPHPDGWGVLAWTSDGATDAETYCDHCNKVLVEGDEN